MAKAAPKVRLGREDWIAAALQALADDGPAGVAVERLASRLGATKGSFYWHFKDREELVTETLATWERDDTDIPIEEMNAIADPVERLRFGLALATEYDEAERPDVRLLPSASDPAVGEAIRRVEKKRLAYLAQTFRELGFTPAESRVRARMAYSLSLGWQHQRLIEGDEGATSRERTAYQRRTLQLLLSRN
jgi:AcrR family transcriptional regulator